MQNMISTDISTLLIDFLNQEEKSWAIPMKLRVLS